MSAVEYSQSDSQGSSAAEEETPEQTDELTRLEFAAQVYNRVVIMLVLYVLSIGPAFGLWVESMYLQGSPAVARFYYPLLLLCHWFPPFEDLVNWYIELWWF